MPITLNGDTGIQTPMYNGTITANAVTPSVNMKNRIINGNMTIDQRNAGASVTITNTSTTTYTLDRWGVYGSVASKFSVQQDAGAVTPPAGFTDYLGVTSLSAYSISSSDQFVVTQYIEGFNTADLDFGKATAKTVTLSFWVRSSLTGTFGGSVANSAFNRSYPFTYTISSANTWEQKSVTIAGDTTGTWLVTNGIGLQVNFGLGVGSSLSGTAGAWAGATYVSATGATSVVGTNGATFYITGVQLEVGSTATSFDYRSIGTETSLCQRYYFQQGGGNYTRFGGAIALARSTTQATSVPFFPVAMRTFPTVSSVNLSSTSINSTAVSTISLSSDESTPNFPVGPARLNVFVSGGLTSGVGYEWESNNNNTTRITFSAEL